MNTTNLIGPKSNANVDPVNNENTTSSVSESLSLQDQCNNKGIELFNKLAQSFANFYAIAPIMAKEVSSENYGRFLSCLETCILASEHASKDCTDIQCQEQLSDMKAKFEEVYEMMPLGPSVLLQRDLNRLSMLAKIPQNETYSCPLGEFYEPQISLIDLSMFFQHFIKKHGYAGVDIVMKTDRNSNRLPSDKMITSIAFEYEENTPSAFSIFNKKEKKSSREDQTKEVIELITPHIEKWRFSSFQVGHTDDIKDDLAKRGINVKKWGLFVEFVHIKVEKDSNQDKPTDSKNALASERSDKKSGSENISTLPTQNNNIKKKTKKI